MRIKKIKWFLLAHKNENWREAKLICKVKNERRGEHNQQMVFVMPDVSLNAADISVIGRNILPVTLCFHYAPHRHTGLWSSLILTLILWESHYYRIIIYYSLPLYKATALQWREIGEL